MNRIRSALAFSTLLTGSLILTGTLAGLKTFRSQASPNVLPAARIYDPLVFTGSSLSGLVNAPIDELSLYRYQNAGWAPIPFQIDEVDLTGTLVLTGDGRLDLQDELVWMVWDAGEQAPAGAWPADPFARLNPRVEIRITDPISPGFEAWVYLFRSGTLQPSGVSYVTWIPGIQTADTLSYTLAFDYENFVGIADLTLQGSSVDILDRQKVRGEISPFGTGLPFDEEDLADVITSPIRFSAQGPVRLATGSGNQRLAVYGRSFESTLLVDTTGLGQPPDFVRTSLDLNNPSTTGLTTYFDSNTPGGVTIDGVPDPIPAAPLLDWAQVSGGAAGPGGFVTVWGALDPGGGTLSNYYLDDASSNDPGDGSSYADAGILFDGPGQVITLSLAAYILPPGTAANVGDQVFAWYEAPLQTSGEVQALAPPAQIFLPVIRRP